MKGKIAARKTLFEITPRQCKLLIQQGGVCTFDFCFEVWIFVKHCHLLFPVKLVSPVGNHSLEIGGIEAILEAAILQRISVAGSVNALMKVLLNKNMLLSCYWYSRCTEFGRLR